jgi:DNA-binding MarR family transcriptional regulator
MSNRAIQADASQTANLVDHELDVLEHLARAKNVRQRDLARIIGMSLGMTNAILKRLAHKGLITIRKVNNRNIMYAVSPDGMEEIARRSYRYLKRTIKNVVVYRETIDSLVRLIADQGFSEVELVEQSDLDFIVEHACEIQGVVYRRARVKAGSATPGLVNPGPANPGPADPGRFLLHSEQLEPPAGRRTLEELESAVLSGAREAYLSEVLI